MKQHITTQQTMQRKLSKYAIPFMVFCTLLSSTPLLKATPLFSGQTYKITSTSANKVLSVKNSALEREAEVVIWTETNVNAQRWVVTLNSDNTYQLSNSYSGKMLYRRGAAASGAKICQYDKSDLSAGKWIVQPVDNQGNNFYITQKSGTQTLYLEAIDTGEGAAVELHPQKTGSQAARQIWTLESVSSMPNRMTEAIRDEIMQRWKEKYYKNWPFVGWMLGGGIFWNDAEMFEIILDAYETTGNPVHEETFRNLYTGFIKRKGSNWRSNDYNDDIAWMVLASVRAYLLFGDAQFLHNAKQNFDMMYTRALLPSGMLRWKESSSTQNRTNSCINGPAGVAACYLAIATNDDTYYEKAKALYTLQRQYLYEPATGKVYDSFTWQNGQPTDYNYWASTYNQGTFLGAALMLYNRYGTEQYLTDADMIMKYTLTELCDSEGIVKVCAVGADDLAGFKGILMRYVRRFIIEQRQTQYADWMLKNALHAYNNRNSAGISSSAWLVKSPENFTLDDCAEKCSFKTDPFGPSTIVSAAFNAPLPENRVIKDAFLNIEAEHFTYLKGVHVQKGTDDATPEIGNIKNGYYTIYHNVTFGLNMAKSVELRVSKAGYGGAQIEIRQDTPTGLLLATVSVPQSGATWQTISQSITPVGGIKNICLVYLSTQGTDNLFALNHFKFSTDSHIYPDITDNGGALQLLNSTHLDCRTAEMLIDNSLETEFSCSDAVGGVVLQYHSPIPVNVKGYALASGAEWQASYPKSWKFQASNNAEEWIDLDIQTGQLFESSYQKKSIDISNADLYSYFRLWITEKAGYSDEFRLAEWQIYGNALFQTDITADGGVLTTQYVGTTPNETAPTLIDKQVKSKYTVENQTDIWVQYQSNAHYLLTAYTLTSSNDLSRRDPKSWILYGSKEGTHWHIIDSRTNQIFPYRNVTHTYRCTPNAGYRYFKLHITEVNGSSSTQLAEWQLLGRYFIDRFYNDVTKNGGELSSSQGNEMLTPTLLHLTDNDAATFYELKVSQLPIWLQYKSAIPVQLRAYSVMAADDVNKAIRNWRLQGSNDGVQWTDIDYRSNITFSLKGEQKTYPISNNSNYLYFRLSVTSMQDAAATAMKMAEWELHGTGIKENDLTDNGGALTAEYAGIAASEGIEKLSDNSVSTKYCTHWNGISAWMQYQSSMAVKLAAYSLTSANDFEMRDPQSWTIKGSDNGVEWVEIDKREGQFFPARFVTQYYNCNPESKGYRYYQLEITKNHGANLLQLAEWQLFPNPESETALSTPREKWVVAYPNPVKEHLTLTMPTRGVVKLFNAMGYLLMVKSVAQGSEVIPFGSYGQGVYFLQVNTDSRRETIKILK